MSQTSKASTPMYSAAQRREAAEWFVIIRDGNDPHADTLQAWLRWMEADEGNRVAFEAVSAAWHETATSLMVAMPTQAELADDAYDGELPVSQWRSRLAAPLAGRSRPTGGGIRARQIVLAAAAVAAWAAVGWFFYGETMRPHAPSWGVFETKVGEHRDLKLADGSRISLGAKSRLVVRFNHERREMRLETGEAYFEVEKDARRPFIVQALGGSITALGTAFNVHAIRGHVTVMVAEGAVSVRDSPAPESAASGAPAAEAGQVRVSSGQQVTFDLRGQGPLLVRAAPDLAEKMRWREGWLIYRNALLGDVIADVSRYTERRIEVSDRNAANLRFSGSVYREAIEEWLVALPEAFPVTVEGVSREDGSRPSGKAEYRF